MTRDPDEHALADTVPSVRDAPAGQSPAGRTPADWRVLRGGPEWADGMLVLALLAVCAGVGLAVAVRTLWPDASSTAAAIPGAVAAAVVVVWALVRARPVGLLRARWLDVLWGLGWGVVGLVVAGWISTVVGGAAGLPTTGLPQTTGRGALLSDAAVMALVVPTLLTLLLSGVLLVSAFTVIRRRWSLGPSAILAGALSIACAVLLSLSTDAGAASAILATVMAATCSALVLLTGRVWGAIFAHLVAAGAYALLAVVGTVWA